MSANAYTPRRTSWSATWNTFGLGTLYEVDPALDLITAEIKRGSTGEIVLGEWIIGLKGVVKVQLADITRIIQEKMTPWFSGVSGTDSIPLVPMTFQQNMYQYAQELVLHPNDLTTTKEDLHLIKTVPIVTGRIKRDGMKDEVWETTFVPFPDLSRLQASPPVPVWGYVGDVAI